MATSTPKKPADHKTKKPTNEVDSITVTLRGHDWTIEADALNDWEVFEGLSDPTGMHMAPVVRTLLGDQQYQAAKDLVRNPETGQVPATEMSNFIGELFEALKEAQQGNS
ncbi:MAG: hypothetical protein FWF28_02755 [Micrococcales bacterium]|nr:hypothetical protein [Micrococcales bacterium]